MVFSSHEQLLWGHIPELVESIKQDCLAQAYAVHVMSQHLGANHVDGGVWFRFSSFMSCYCDLLGYCSLLEEIGDLQSFPYNHHHPTEIEITCHQCAYY